MQHLQPVGLILTYIFCVLYGGGEDELVDSWTKRMRACIEEARQRGLKTGVMDSEMEALAGSLYERYRSYFGSVASTTYYGDICSKNVMIHDGVFNGLVDLDALFQGDPLEAIGRIKLSWHGTTHGELYTNAIMNELGLNPEQRRLVMVYAILNKISWTCENGIQFNQNTTGEVDREKEEQDKYEIKTLVEEAEV